MKITNTEKQDIKLKKNIKKYFLRTQPCLERGFCPTKDLLADVLDKWSLFCMYHLGYYETLRFGELKNNIEGISSRMLSVTLKKLEAHGIVHRENFTEIPPRVEYSLTPFGKELSNKIVNLSNWILDFSEEIHKS